MKNIFIFEDDDRRSKELRSALIQRLRSRCTITEAPRGAQQDNKNYEKQIESILKEFLTNGILIVCDKDLSDLKPQFIGLSGSTVCAVADKLGIPICLYARGEDSQDGEEFLKRLAPWENKRIILDFKDPKFFADECAEIFKGFDQIEKSYAGLENKLLSNPSATLAHILGKEEMEDRIALYSSGEQGYLSEIMPFIQKETKDTNIEIIRRMPRLLGNWLYTSILRFPGILIDHIAAASYLNIHIDDFKKAEVKGLFKKAKYQGPFSGMSEWWWRHEIDHILNGKGCEDGYQFVKLSQQTVRPCKEAQTKDRAGYYCMVTCEPVSEDNSRGGISWFPAGADLARIRKDKFNELAPWVGLY